MEIARIPETTITAVAVAGLSQRRNPGGSGCGATTKTETTLIIQPQQRNIWLWASVF